MKVRDYFFRNEENRTEWVIRELRKIPNGKRILDAGAGIQRYRKYCEHLEYVSQDFCQYNGDKKDSFSPTDEWNTSKTDIVSDITDIPVEDSSFDVIMCTEVFEHIPDPISAVKEFSRILKSGGELILSAPFCSTTHQAPYFYYNGFTTYWYNKILEENGFKIESMEPNGDFYSFVMQKLLRTRAIAEYYSHKRMNIFDYAAIIHVLLMLKRFRKKDTGSYEYLCFGYHIIAKKN